jgi:DNA-binding MarR family transcriptional regulator
MSKQKSRNALLDEVMRAVAAFQDATDQVDDAAAARLGLNRTDLQCLAILGRTGAKTAGQLAQASGLSPGATTTAVDRLMRAGFAERVRDEGDRRRVTILLTPAAEIAAKEIWGPIGAEAHRRLSRRADSELALILDFLTEGCQLQARHAARIRATGS